MDGSSTPSISSVLGVLSIPRAEPTLLHGHPQSEPRELRLPSWWLKRSCEVRKNDHSSYHGAPAAQHLYHRRSRYGRRVHRERVGAHGRVDGLDPDRPIRIARLEIDHVSVTEAEFPGMLNFETDQWPCYLVTEVKGGRRADRLCGPGG